MTDCFVKNNSWIIIGISLTLLLILKNVQCDPLKCADSYVIQPEDSEASFVDLLTLASPPAQCSKWCFKTHFIALEFYEKDEKKSGKDPDASVRVGKCDSLNICARLMENRTESYACFNVDDVNFRSNKTKEFKWRWNKATLHCCNWSRCNQDSEPNTDMDRKNCTTLRRGVWPPSPLEIETNSFGNLKIGSFFVILIAQFLAVYVT